MFMVVSRAVKMGSPAWLDPTRLDPPQVDHLVSQPNPSHWLASKKIPTRLGPPRVGGLNGLVHGLN